jgi:hypothetical protein
MLREWRREAVRAENGETTRGEYDEWRFDYPVSEARQTSERLRDARRKEKEGV